MSKSFMRRLEAQRAGTGEPAQAKAIETSAASRPETLPTVGSPVPAPCVAGITGGAPGFQPGEAGSIPAPRSIFPTRAQFGEWLPKLSFAKQDPYYDALRAACEEFGIDTALRVAAALAQWSHETMGFQFLEELGGKTWWVRYEGRRDLGNTVQGDGIRYHGRGVVQLTGKANYIEFGDALGVDLLHHPELAALMPVAARLGGIFWKRRGLNVYADMNTDEGFRRMTIRLNGGVNGITDRYSRWKALRKIMGIDPKGA